MAFVNLSTSTLKELLLLLSSIPSEYYLAQQVAQQTDLLGTSHLLSEIFLGQHFPQQWSSDGHARRLWSRPDRTSGHQDQTILFLVSNELIVLFLAQYARTGIDNPHVNPQPIISILTTIISQLNSI